MKLPQDDFNECNFLLVEVLVFAIYRPKKIIKTNRNIVFFKDNPLYLFYGVFLF